MHLARHLGMTRALAALSVAALSLAAGCASPGPAPGARSDAELTSLAQERTKSHDGISMGYSKIHATPQTELKKIGILSVHAKSNHPDAQVAESLARELEKALIKQGFEVVPLKTVAAAPSWSQKGEGTSADGGFAAGSRQFEGFGAMALTMSDEWMSNLGRETGCDVFIVVDAHYQWTRRIFVFFPADAAGWIGTMHTYVPYAKVKMSADANGVHIPMQAQNNQASIQLSDTVDTGVDEGLKATSLMAELMARGFRAYYPKPSAPKS